MDDFIDDSDVNPNQISEMIREITGYDKRRYWDEPEDDICMETSIYEQMKEERRSLQMGNQNNKIYYFQISDHANPLSYKIELNLPS